MDGGSNPGPMHDPNYPPKCRDCKHYERRWWLPAALATCADGGNAGVTTGLVNSAHGLCVMIRAQESGCSWQGKGFEPK